LSYLYATFREPSAFSSCITRPTSRSTLFPYTTLFRSVAMDRMEFLSPLRVGSQVGCYCELVDIGRSSMKINVEVWTLDRASKTPRKVTEGLFVYVAIDEHGRIREVPEQNH